MAFQPTIYTAVYLGGVAIGIVASVVAWRRRSAPGGHSFLLLIFTAAWWCFSDAMESAAVGIPAHVLWAQIAYLGNMAVGCFLLLFAVEYTGRRRWSASSTLALFLVPAIGMLAAFTNRWHSLIWTGFASVPGGQNLVSYSHGWLAWVVALYNLGVALVAGAMLVEFAVRSKAPYRRQGIAIVAAIAVPWIAMLVYIFNSDVLPGVDPSVTIVLSGALMAMGLVRFRLLDLIPVARERLIEHMEDGLLVFDGDMRILDANPAAARIVGGSREAWIGLDIRAALSAWPELADCLAGAACGEDGTIVSPAGRSISVSAVPLADSHSLSGTLVTLRDATKQAETEAALHAMNDDLHERVLQVEKLQEELREQAIRDPLTGLFNRRYLTETLEREIGRARREGYPVSLVMVDIDHFKRINDEHGHAAGDQALRFLGAQFRAGMRTGDIACRYGGDEFLLVMPNTPPEYAYARAEEWGKEVKAASVYWMEWPEPTTLSLGVASFPAHGANVEQIMNAADAALYDAKHSGRDSAMLSSGARRPARLDRSAR